MGDQLSTYHIHISGIVQGVGFRPFIYKLAKQYHFNGWVNNTHDGVHIEITLSEISIVEFIQKIEAEKPISAQITNIDYYEAKSRQFDNFRIIHSENRDIKNLLVTPDFSMCEKCRTELYDPENRRFHYAFASCTNCGPRYSIIKKLPYDRDKTSMYEFQMCDDCKTEYDDPLDRRYYHQTNSCRYCPVTMQIIENGQTKILDDQVEIIDYIVKGWKDGKIIALKGIGGYLITCDATNSATITRLRQLKKRPQKPFALMYHDIFYLAEDVELEITGAEELKSMHSPIVLLTLKEELYTPIAVQEIAPNLGQIGVMLPYTPLYDLLLKKFGKPIVATSGNVSGSTIVYKDANIAHELMPISDIVVSNNREIVIPQDDSVIKLSPIKKQRIILRRSRGLAPSYIQKYDMGLPERTILCMGAALKSTFTLLHQGNIYISQYIGDTDDYNAQQNYSAILNHIVEMLGATPELIITDSHPNYYATRYGREIANKSDLPVFEIQHHKAHFWAILAEHNLWDKKVTGVIWDGTGLGEDGQIWGGEFFHYDAFEIKRSGHLDYYDFFLGDKMPREPRISAFAITKGDVSIQHYFSDQEWRIYSQLIKDNSLKSSSAGRLFDAAACIILGIKAQTYEGEAAMQLEHAAHQYFRMYGATTFYTYLKDDEIPPNFPKYILSKLIHDKAQEIDPQFLAAKFHISLAHYITNWVKKIGNNRVAFSGGVFQNGWLTDLVKMFLEPDYDLYFHRDISPNDEGVSFGQLFGYIKGKSK